jgi:hypothetical protein
MVICLPTEVSGYPEMRRKKGNGKEGTNETLSRKE